MQIIGLTGGIATGKSTVAKRMQENGACVIDIDRIAKGIVSKQVSFLREHSPEAMNNGKVCRKVLAQKLFSDAQFRKKLDRLVHPRVVAYVLAMLVFKYLIGTQTVVLDIPLLFETGFDSWMSITIVVYTEKDIEIDRLCKREQISKEEAERRIDAQMPLQLKSKRATFVIQNNGVIDTLNAEVDKLMATIKPKLLHWVYWLPIPAIVVLVLFYFIMPSS
jgi:dephospho-CoA kinase